MGKDRKRDHPGSPGDIISKDLSFSSKNPYVYSGTWILLKKADAGLERRARPREEQPQQAWGCLVGSGAQTIGSGGRPGAHPAQSLTSFVILGKPLNSRASLS